MEQKETAAPTAAVAAWCALLQEVRALVLDVAGTDLTELEIAFGGIHVRLEQEPGASDPVVPGPATPRDAVETGLVPVISPLNGVFYSRPVPTAAPYVQVGDPVEVDQVLCLVEAMKSFNEIRSELAGRVARLCVENGQVVNAGDTLLLLESAVPAPLPAAE